MDRQPLQTESAAVVSTAKLQRLFGAAVRAHRETAGLSQEGLALEAGVDRSFVSQIERGVRQPSLTTIWKLAAALGVAPSNLLLQVEKQLSST